MMDGEWRAMCRELRENTDNPSAGNGLDRTSEQLDGRSFNDPALRLVLVLEAIMHHASCTIPATFPPDGRTAR